MRFGTYLASSWPVVACTAATAALCGFMLSMVGAARSLALFVALLIVVTAAVSLVVMYVRKRSFYGALEAATDDAAHALWVTELVDEPTFAEGASTYEALRRVTKSANDTIAAYRNQTAEYRAYVETWVHEAKSPLAAAHLMMENIEEELAALADDDAAVALSAKVRALDGELNRVEDYVEQALFYARSESLDRDYLIRACSLRDVVGAAIKAQAHLLIPAHIAPFRKNLDVTVFTDEKWLVFILGQLIQNSVRYARPKGAAITFEAEMRDAGLSHERIELTVADNGCGCSAADVPRVFDRGFTGQNGRTGKRSTGIGLYLVKRLCDKMGLAVRAASEEGRGFAVTISFPTNKMHYFA